MRSPAPTQREPEADNTSPSFIGVSTPSESKRESKTTAAKAATDMPAFLSLAGFEAKAAKDDTSVMRTAIISIINAKFIMGETEEKFPAKPAISIASSPLRNMTNYITKLNTPNDIATYLVIF